MNLLVAIPALNEEMTIQTVIEQIPRRIAGVDQIEILVVDDGSTDRTVERAKAAGARVISHSANLGVGMAFQTVVRQALEQGADVLVTLDGDGQFDPREIPQLVQPILVGEAGACTASRFADPALEPEMPWAKRWGNHRVASLVSQLSGKRIHDASCGFRSYSREALLNLTVHQTFTYTHETLLDLAAKSVEVTEVPMRVRGTREFGSSRVASSLLRYGVRTSLIMLRFYRDHHPLALMAGLAASLSVAGLLLLTVSFISYLQTNAWLKWAALSGGALLVVATGVVFIGFLVDIVSRLRRNQEEILYWLRSQASERAHDERNATTQDPGRRSDGSRPQ